jgi:hypothetical protein
MAVSDEEIAQLRSWAVGEIEEVDWFEVDLPPCVNTVRDSADTPTRRARVARAYYDPEITEKGAVRGRTTRIAAGQAVVVSPDGSILATWQVPTDSIPTQPSGPRRRQTQSGRRGVPSGPRDHADLLRMLDEEGIRVERTTRHLRVLAPDGAVFLSGTPSDVRTVRNTVALLRRYGCTLRHDR